MKSLMLVFVSMFIFTGFASSQSTTTTENPDKPVASFDRMVYDMGNIDLGIPKEAKFILTNTGKEPLVILSGHASCGCTNLKYSPDPILSGKSVEIVATYNAGVTGPFFKTISITTNADAAPVVLQIKGTVVEKTQQ